MNNNSFSKGITRVLNSWFFVVCAVGYAIQVLYLCAASARPFLMPWEDGWKKWHTIAGRIICKPSGRCATNVSGSVLIKRALATTFPNSRFLFRSHVNKSTFLCNLSLPIYVAFASFRKGNVLRYHTLTLSQSPLTSINAFGTSDFCGCSHGLIITMSTLPIFAA